MSKSVPLLTILLFLGACANPGPNANVGFSFQVGGGPTATGWQWGNPNAYAQAKANNDRIVAAAESRARLERRTQSRGLLLRPGQSYVTHHLGTGRLRNGTAIRCQSGHTPHSFYDAYRQEVGLRC